MTTTRWRPVVSPTSRVIRCVLSTWCSRAARSRATASGTVVTTTQCLMHPNRNPTMTKVEIEAVLRAELGTEQLLWLPHGLALDDDTDGHVDNIAAFAAPGRLVLQGCDDTDEDDWLRLDVDRRVRDGRDRCPRAIARRDRDPGAPVRRGRRRAGGRAVPQLLRRQRVRRRADVRPPRRRRHGGDDRRPVSRSRHVRRSRSAPPSPTAAAASTASPNRSPRREVSAGQLPRTPDPKQHLAG